MDKKNSSLLLVGHGSTENPDSSPPTLDHAETIRARGIFREVHCCFWKEEPQYRDARYLLDADEVYVVPVFISEGYFTRSVIPRELGLDGALSEVDGVLYKYCKPVGSHPNMTEVLLERARQTAPGIAEEETTLLIVGHGTALNQNSAVAAKTQARLLSERTGYARVLSTYMEEEPLITDWHQLAETPNVLVVPFFIADGLHSYQDIPVMLGIESEPTEAASKRAVFRDNPRQLRGRNLYYASAIGTEPQIAELILDQVRDFDLEHGTPEPAG